MSEPNTFFDGDPTVDALLETDPVALSAELRRRIDHFAAHAGEVVTQADLRLMVTLREIAAVHDVLRVPMVQGVMGGCRVEPGPLSVRVESQQRLILTL